MARTRGNDHGVVVQDVAIGEHHTAAVDVDLRHFGKQHADIAGSAQDPAYGRGNIAW
jgi:hypothetical protein